MDIHFKNGQIPSTSAVGEDRAKRKKKKKRKRRDSETESLHSSEFTPGKALESLFLTAPHTSNHIQQEKTSTSMEWTEPSNGGKKNKTSKKKKKSRREKESCTESENTHYDTAADLNPPSTCPEPVDNTQKKSKKRMLQSQASPIIIREGHNDSENSQAKQETDGNTTKKSKKRKNQRQLSSSTIEEGNDDTENIDCGQGKHESEGRLADDEYSQVLREPPTKKKKMKKKRKKSSKLRSPGVDSSLNSPEVQPSLPLTGGSESEPCLGLSLGDWREGLNSSAPSDINTQRGRTSDKVSKVANREQERPIRGMSDLEETTNLVRHSPEEVVQTWGQRSRTHEISNSEGGIDYVTQMSNLQMGQRAMESQSNPLFDSEGEMHEYTRIASELSNTNEDEALLHGASDLDEYVIQGRHLSEQEVNAYAEASYPHDRSYLIENNRKHSPHKSQNKKDNITDTRLYHTAPETTTENQGTDQNSQLSFSLPSWEVVAEDRPTPKRWSSEEDAQLKRNWERYLQAHPIDEPYSLLNKQGSTHSKDFIVTRKRETQLYTKLSIGINRNEAAVKCRARRLFHPHKDNKIVSKADKEVAKDLRDVGHSWESIGETFEVPGQKANDAVRHGGRAKKAELKGEWAKEEEEDLLNAMLHVTGMLDIRENVPWTKVADLVRCRNDRQCRSHWINSLYWTAVCGRPRKRFMPKDFKELVQAIEDSEAEEENEIDWRIVAGMVQADVPLPTFLKEKFDVLKKKFEVKGKPLKATLDILRSRLNDENLLDS